MLSVIKFIVFQIIVIMSLLSSAIFQIISIEFLIAPLAIVISSVGAVFVASKTIESNTNINILKTTIDKIDKNYPIRNEHYAIAVRKIAQELGPLGKTGNELTYNELSAAVNKLSKDEHSKIKELLNYYNDIARGIKQNLYDLDWVETSISGAHISVWFECWPVVKWHQLLDERMQKTYDIEMTKGITPMYQSLEQWVANSLKSRNIYPQQFPFWARS
jgi:uncharacterized phage infection (PIP) family protein YhgE